MPAFPPMARSRPAEGLYDPRFEHDACGVAFVATLTGEASHDIVVKALTALRNLEHRGAAGAEPNSGDGAGILLQVPDAFLRAVCGDEGFELTPAGTYAVGTAFLPGDDDQVAKTRRRIEELAEEEGLAVLGWRDVPTQPGVLGRDRALGDAGVQPGLRRGRRASGSPGWPWSAGPSACASAPRRRPTSTSRRCRRGPWPTRGCSPPTSSTSSSPTSSTSGSPPRWRSCTRASRPTPSRAGRWPTRSGSSPTTARSTPSWATATGCAPARRCSPPT